MSGLQPVPVIRSKGVLRSALAKLELADPDRDLFDKLQCLLMGIADCFPRRRLLAESNPAQLRSRCFKSAMRSAANCARSGQTAGGTPLLESFDVCVGEQQRAMRNAGLARLVEHEAQDVLDLRRAT